MGDLDLNEFLKSNKPKKESILVETKSHFNEDKYMAGAQKINDDVDNSANNDRGKSKEDALARVEEDILNNLSCPLKDAATNLVFGKGNPDAKILFIGEAPGAKEDLQGVPFVGSAGRELDKLLNQIGLSISDVYIANILKYRPPGNRNPSSAEIKAHTPFLLKQISIIEPKIVCTLGNYATKFALAGFKIEGMSKIEGISSIHGVPQKVKDLLVVPLYHPAAMLYNPNLRNVLSEDFEKLKNLL